MKLTANSRVAVRRGIAGDYTDLTTLQGLNSWTTADTKRIRSVPSLTALAVAQLLDVTDSTAGFTIDDNATTAPLLYLRSGQVFQLRIQPEGLGVGLDELIYTGPARINHLNTEAGARNYRFDLTATQVDYTVQA